MRNQQLVRDGDLHLISAPFDFFGLNYYIREVVAADGSEPNRGWRRVPPYGELTSKGDGIAPDGLTNVLQRTQHDYATDLPIYITESGAPYNDYVNPEGQVNDPERIEYLAAHFDAARAANRKRRRPTRLLRLVAPRQLRMGLRLRDPLRHRLRRLPHPAAHPEIERTLVPRSYPRERHPRRQRSDPCGTG
jgi:hypothetical protein